MLFEGFNVFRFFYIFFFGLFEEFITFFLHLDLKSQAAFLANVLDPEVGGANQN